MRDSGGVRRPTSRLPGKKGSEAKRAALEAEIAKLDAACRKARQINRRNELFAQLKAKQRELSELMRSRSPSPYVHKKDRPFAQ